MLGYYGKERSGKAKKEEEPDRIPKKQGYLMKQQENEYKMKKDDLNI